MGARFAEFCGWLFQDLGSPVRALTLTDMAMEYAQEIGDIRLTSYLLSRKANIVGENGEPGHSIGLTNAALRSKHALTPQLRALALRQKARALAVIGERESCLETLEQAMEFASDEPASDEFFASYCTSSYIEM